MTSVPQAAHVRDVFFNPETGLLAAPRNQDRKKLYLELSTIDAAVSSEVAEAVASGGFGNFIDAPCSVRPPTLSTAYTRKDLGLLIVVRFLPKGGAMGAENGTLSFMVGSPDELYPQVLEICKLVAKEDGIFHCGGLGSGLKTKLLNNYLSCLTALATAETFNIGVRAGLNAQSLLKVINASSDMSFNSKVNNPVPGLTPNNAASNGYHGGFSIELCLGVLELGVKAGDDLDAMMPLGKPMLNAYREVAAQEKFKGKDSKVIYKWIGGLDPDLKQV